MPRKEIADIAAGRLSADELARNFADVAPPLDRQRALIAAQRCYYCYDAPCIQACPTGIDIPGFIRRITTDNLDGAARDILGANILGGMCARVCPTEILCEGSCVRNGPDELAPVQIGALQRYATDWVFEDNTRLFERGAESWVFDWRRRRRSGRPCLRACAGARRPPRDDIRCARKARRPQ